MTERHVVLVSCPDRPGLVAAVAGLIHRHGGNIVDVDQHTDAADQWFTQRVEFTLEGTNPAPFEEELRLVADDASMQWSLHRTDERQTVVVLVSQQGHCLYDLLSRWELGELDGDIVSVVSNHDDHRRAVERAGLPFVHLPIDDDDPAGHRRDVAAALAEFAPDLVVLARYMRILDPEVTRAFPSRIINIHHSFLPAFVGARPYHQAHARGVKIIGATAHYATAELDEGPIICQDVTPVSHRDGVERLVARGRDLEGVVLARAVQYHLQRRVLTVGNRTVVFD